jgi:hypothetical protein
MPKPTGLNILRHLGMIGSPLSMGSGGIVPRAATPAAQAAQRDDFFDLGRVANPEIWYAHVMKRPSTLEAQLQLWDEMSTWDLITAALVEIVDETIQADTFKDKSIWYESSDKKSEDEVNQMLQHINAEGLLPSQVWHVASLGNHYEKIDYAVGDGIRGLTFVHPFDIRRFWLERNRQCIGFRWKGHVPNKEDIYVQPDNKTPIERVALSTGSAIEDLYYPWDFMHMRRMFRLRSTEHGEPLFDEAQGIYKKLRLALDQMVVHRAQVQPDRYVVNIDTQDLPPTEQMKVVNRWRQSLRNKQTFGLGTDSQSLNTPDEFRSFYNPWALDTIFYMARPKGVAHAIEKLAGTPQVPDVFDIELLIDLFFSIIGMPKSWFGLGGGSSGGAVIPSGRSLLAQDIRFLRKVKSLRRPIVESYTWLAYFHLLLRGVDIQHVNCQAKMPDIGGLEEQMKMDLIKSQAEVLGMLGDVMTQYNLPKEAWVELIFKRYLHLPDEIVNVFITSLPAEREPVPMEGLTRAPSESKILEMIGQRLAGSSAVSRLRDKISMYFEAKTFSSSGGVMTSQQFLKTMQAPVACLGDRCGISTESMTAVAAADSKGKRRPMVKLQESQGLGGESSSNGGPDGTQSMPRQWRQYMPSKMNGHA